MRDDKFEIAYHSVGKDSPCFVIAEAGVAHFGSVDKAKKLVDMAVLARADAVKFQIFDIDRMISSEAQEWKERLGDRCLSGHEFRRIKEYCDEQEIIFLATPHDEYGLDQLNNLDVPAYKIGSGELGNWSFIEMIAKVGKPVILSTGMYQLTDVHKALEVFEKVGNRKIALLHCVTIYPAPPEELNLNVISLFKKTFGGVIGYSDHTEGSHIPLAAVALGADIIEKHISLDFNVPNAQDWKVSCGPDSFIEFVQQLRDVECSLGQPYKVVGAMEQVSRTWACKSLVMAYDHKAGDDIGLSSLVAKRPGTGIPVSDIDKVLGKTLGANLPADHVLKWEHFE